MPLDSDDVVPFYCLYDTVTAYGGHGKAGRLILYDLMVKRIDADLSGAIYLCKKRTVGNYGPMAPVIEKMPIYVLMESTSKGDIYGLEPAAYAQYRFVFRRKSQYKGPVACIFVNLIFQSGCRLLSVIGRMYVIEGPGKDEPVADTCNVICSLSGERAGMRVTPRVSEISMNCSGTCFLLSKGFCSGHCSSLPVMANLI